MSITTLHITNGNSFSDNLREFDYQGDILTWQEMLCEGPTIAKIDSQEFHDIRRKFLSERYDIVVNEKELKEELSKLDDVSNYTEIVLWFEYDLYCHINMIGVLNLLHQKNIKLPLYLVCSGRITGKQGLFGLAELTQEQLRQHYNDKIRLTEDDKDLAIALWRIYCGKDHNIFKPYIVETSSFKYLSNCLKAHLKRFPNALNGLDTIEAHILKIVKDKPINNRNHLLGYALNYQGFYGYGDLQLDHIIKTLSIFFTEDEQGINLNRKGHEALMNHHNFASVVNNNLYFGGVRRLDYQFSPSRNKLVKTIINAY
ncbi:MAG: DUF1835 domain-containing protein [Bacteroidia bacterium]|nr:DUF1835 domain-containing protein [Bacteroidia bacterium]